MINSWERQVLGHVNQVCDISINGNWILDLLVINIDLDRRNIVARKDQGEGAFITLFNVDNVIILDKTNRRPGKSEYNPETIYRG